jgi:putative nucleotidyltransferase with HDIG domain
MMGSGTSEEESRRRSDLLDRICSSEGAPTLPFVAANVLALCNDPDINFATLATCISSDMGLTSKFLSIANSALFGGSQKVASINAAIVRMGVKRTRLAVLGFSLQAELGSKVPPEFDIERFWRHSLTTASAAGSLAETVRPADRDDALSAGLLQDIGMAVMQCALPQEYLKVFAARREAPEAEIWDLEREILGLTHMEVGSELLRRWNLPDKIYLPILHHHAADNTPFQGLAPDLANVTRMLLFGAMVSRFFRGISADVTIESLTSVALRDFQMQPEALTQMLDRIQSNVQEVCALFGISPGPAPVHAETQSTDGSVNGAAGK